MPKTPNRESAKNVNRRQAFLNEQQREIEEARMRHAEERRGLKVIQSQAELDAFVKAGFEGCEKLHIGDTIRLPRPQEFKLNSAEPTALSIVLQGIRFRGPADRAACLEAVDRYVRNQNTAIVETFKEDHKRTLASKQGEVNRLRGTIRQMYSRHANDLIDRDMDQMLAGTCGQEVPRGK